MADIFKPEDLSLDLTSKLPETKPPRGNYDLPGTGPDAGRGLITQELLGDPIDMPAAETPPGEDSVARDLGKTLGGAAVEATGNMVRSVGEDVKDPLRRVEDVSLIFKLARGLGIIPKPAAGQPNRLDPHATRIEKYGEQIKESASEAGKAAMEASTPDGDLTDPSSWTFGDDPTLRGYAMQGAAVLGSMMPVLASVVLGKVLPAAGAGAGAYLGGAQGGGAAAAEARKTIAGMTDEKLEMESARYRELREQGASPTAARLQVSREAEEWAHRLTQPVSALGGAATSALLSRPSAIVGGLSSRVARGAGLGAIAGTEESIQEVWEGVQTARGVNRGAGMERSVTEGSFGNAVLGFMGGGGPGTIAGLMTPNPEKPGARDIPAEEAGGAGGPGGPGGPGAGLATRERAQPADWEVVDDLPATTQARQPGEQGDLGLPALGGPTAPAGPGGAGPGDAGGGGGGATFDAGRQQPTDRVSRFGLPFMLRSTAEAEAEASGGEVVQVEGGFVVRGKPDPVLQDDDPVPEGWQLSAPFDGESLTRQVATKAGQTFQIIQRKADGKFDLVRRPASGVPEFLGRDLASREEALGVADRAIQQAAGRTDTDQAGAAPRGDGEGLGLDDGLSPSGKKAADLGSAINASVDESARDRVLADAKLFGDRANADAIRVHGFDSLDRQAQHVVLSHVRRALDQQEVARVVVQSVPVDVVNGLVGEKASAENSLHDEAVLAGRLSVPRNVAIPKPVTRFVDALASALESALARRGAEKPDLADAPGAAKGDPAVGAGPQRADDAGAAAKTPTGVTNAPGGSVEGDAASGAAERDNGHVKTTQGEQKDTTNPTPKGAQKEADPDKKGHARNETDETQADDDADLDDDTDADDDADLTADQRTERDRKWAEKQRKKDEARLAELLKAGKTPDGLTFKGARIEAGTIKFDELGGWKVGDLAKIRGQKEPAPIRDLILTSPTRGKAPWSRALMLFDDGMVGYRDIADLKRPDDSLTKRVNKALKDSGAREMDAEGRPKDGKPVKPGDTFRTSSGRVTTAYPKQKGEKYASQWLIDNAVAEAESRGDRFNAPIFKRTTIGRGGTLTPADQDSMLEYLFGQQPDVVPSILKPLTGESTATADADTATAAPDTGATADPVNATELQQGIPADTLVLMACSDTKAKVDGKVPLIDLYAGPLWASLRTNLGAIPRENVFAFSGKLGFKPATHQAASYNERLTPEKADEAIQSATALAQLLARDNERIWSNVLIVGSEQYRRVFNAIVNAAQAQGLLDDGVSIVAATTEGEDGARGGIGAQRKRLNTFLGQANYGKAEPPKTPLQQLNDKLKDADAPKPVDPATIKPGGRYIFHTGNEAIRSLSGYMPREVTVTARAPGDGGWIIMDDPKGSISSFAGSGELYPLGSMPVKSAKPAEPTKQDKAQTDDDKRAEAGKKLRTLAGRALDAKHENLAAALNTMARRVLGLGDRQLPPSLAADMEARFDKLMEKAAADPKHDFAELTPARRETADEKKARERKVAAERAEQERELFRGYLGEQDVQQAAATMDAARFAEFMRAPDRFPAASDKFVKDLQRLAKAAHKQAEKNKHRDPAVLEAAITEGMKQDGIQPGHPAMSIEYRAGFLHALAGKTKSSLSGQFLNVRQHGYEAAKRWIKTDEGRAYYEGKPFTRKLENTGVDLRRYWDAMRAKMKAGESDIKKVWRQIQAATNRADLFAPLMKEGVRPGLQYYFTELRDITKTFGEFLDYDNSRRWWGNEKWGRSGSNLEYVLDGERYPSELAEDGRDRWASEPAFRAEWLRGKAEEYLELVRDLLSTYEGLPLEEAMRRHSERFIKPDTAQQTSSWRIELTATGERIFKGVIQRKKENNFRVLRYESSWAEELRARQDNEQINQRNARKDALVPPRLDRVDRAGLPDYRSGRNVTPDEVKDAFGFADVGFGEYVTAEQRQDHLNYAYDAFMDLAKFWKIDPKNVGFGGRLHFTIGALGHGKFAAHFQPAHPGPHGSVPVINLTNTRGDGTVFHEWTHAYDHFSDWNRTGARGRFVLALSQQQHTVKLVEDYALKFLRGQLIWRGAGRKWSKVQSAVRGMERMEDSNQLATRYKANADELGKDYWGNEHELIARAAEAWALDNLAGVNSYLVNPAWVGEGMVTGKTHRGTPYPEGDERKFFSALYDALRKVTVWTDGIPHVDRDAFLKAMPGEAAAAAARRRELSSIPAMTAFWKEAEARREQEIAEKAQREREEMDRAAEAALAELGEVDPPKPDTAQGPLSEADLEAIFDQAAAELREETAEKPDVPPPGQNLRDAEPDLPAIEDILEPGADPEVWWDKTITHFARRVMLRAAGVKAPDAITWQYLKPEHQRAILAVKAGRPQPDDTAGPVDDFLAGRRPDAPTVDEVADDAAKRAAARMAKEAAKLGVKGIDETLAGLTKLFGGGPGKLNSFPGGFDEDTYKQAKPHFEAALKAFQDAGKTLKDLFKFLIVQFGDGIKEYAVRFAKDQELGAQLAPVAEDGHSPSRKVANWVSAQLQTGLEIRWQDLFKRADAAFGGTQAEGKYTVKDAYDALEVGVNLHIAAHPDLYAPNVGSEAATSAVRNLRALLDRIPTQTKRTAEQDEFQQFSTPPTLAYPAAWVANITAADTMLEPSGGVGGIAVFGHLAGAKLTLNELSSRRAALLREVFPASEVYTHNAEQLDNLLPESVQPTVVVMNPPFSATAGRMQGTRDTAIGAQHIEQALKRLATGGRLVAVVGEGMARDKAAFRAWWKKIDARYDVRAAIPVDGKDYAKYGTTFSNVLLVIDKAAPKADRIVVTREAKSHADLISLLEDIRNDRPAPQAQDQRDDAAERDAALDAHQDALDAEQGGAEPGQPDAAGTPAVGEGEPAAGPGGGADGRADVRGPGGRGRPAGRVPGAGRGRARPDGRADDAGGRDGDGAVDSGSPGGARIDVAQADLANQPGGQLTDSIFESYRPQRLFIDGAQPHPGPLVQSAAMASVLPPPVRYAPALPKNVVTKGLLSEAQLEAVVYAGAAHEQMLPSGERRGFFIGDGTGVGKGREIGGIILDNLRQGRKRAVWISEKQGLMNDAKRDFAGIGGDPDLIFNQNKTKAEDAIDASRDGILFTTYSTLRSGAQSQLTPAQAKQGDRVVLKVPGSEETAEAIIVAKPIKRNGKRYFPIEWADQEWARENGWRNGNISAESITEVKPRTTGKEKKAGQSRLDQLVNYLGEDFDGVIAFDEAHNAGNAVPIKGERGFSEPSAQALAVVELQRRLPKARVVYVSATGATQVSNLSYATRMGLWGEGTPFPSVQNFIAEMEAGGLATMELVARDAKQMGVYLARSLSYDGVTYSRLEHELTPIQREIYDRLSEAWQVTLQNFMEALKATGVIRENGTTANSRALSAAKAAYWGAQQRFFNQIITAMQMPSVVDAIRADIEAGNAVVLQLVNTNEAQQERALAKRRDEAEEADLEDLDLTPRDMLMQMVERSFPVVQMEEYSDEDGKRHSRPMLKPDGTPVLNREMVAKRDQLLKDLAEIRVPDGPLEIILNEFGPETVAEVTGRTQRVVRKPDANGNVKAQIERRGASAARADADDFMADKKPVLVFSDAGGTGFSFHADLTKTNQRKRKHYLIQPGWRADKAVQGFGRTHRTNQASAPHYYLASTDIPAQKRFLSSIARRLDQLGALTKGQRDTANQGLFNEKDNLESKYAQQAVMQFFVDLQRGVIPGMEFGEITFQMGLDSIVNEQTGQITEGSVPKISQFLNRMLSLKLDTQNKVFDAFIGLMEEKIEVAIERGELDAGLETIRGDSIKVTSEDVVYTDPRTGAETRYVELEVTLPNRMYQPPTGKDPKKFFWARQKRSGRVYGFEKVGTTTKNDGSVVDRIRRYGTGGQSYETSDTLIGTDGKLDPVAWEKIDQEDALKLWQAENDKRPTTYTKVERMIVGAILPIWDRLKTGGSTLRVARALADDGRRLLGRVISQKDAPLIRKRLNVASPAAKMTSAEVLAAVLKGQEAELANGWKIRRARVSNELRVELFVGHASMAVVRELNGLGIFAERISWADRYFIPTGAAGVPVLDRLRESKPVVDLVDPDAAADDGARFSRRAGVLGRLDARMRGAQDAGRGTPTDPRSGPLGPLVESLTQTARAAGVSAARLAGLRKAAVPFAARPIVAALRKGFGLDVVFVDGDEALPAALQFDGVYVGTNQVFISSTSSKPFHQVIGHEFLHALKRRHPDLYDELLDRLRPFMRARAAQQYATDRGNEYAEDLTDAARGELGWEETLADTFGDAWNDPKFWRGLAGKAPTLLERMAGIWRAFAMRVRMMLAGEKENPLARQLYKDFDAVRDVIADITQQARGDEAPQKGMPLFSREHRQHVTDTPEFRRWFAGSKVVDSEGRPLVVYHGTTRDFDTFDPSETYDGGLYFTGIADHAVEFAEIKGGESTRVLPVYLSIRNPVVVDAMASGLGNQFNEGWQQALQEMILDAQWKKKHDGIIVRNMDALGYGDSSTMYIAFRPEQIKSATGNAGTFDPGNPDIRFSRRSMAARQRTRPPKEGPIDTLLRAAGGKVLAEKLLTPLYERLLSTAERITPGAIKQGLIADYGLEDAYLDVKDQTRAAINKQLRSAKSLIDMLAGLDRDQSRVAYQWMQEKPDTRAEAEAMARLPEDSREVMRRMKDMIDQLGREAVRAGLLSEEAYQRNRMAYLHRSYRKHEAQSAGRSGRRWKEAARIRAETFKGRGLFHKFDDDRIIRYADEVEKGDRFVRYERRLANGRLAAVRYVPEGRPRPDELAGWDREGVWEVRELGKPSAKHVTMWRDLTKAEREALGEIEEVRFAFAKTAMSAIRDIENARFLAWVADLYGQDPEYLEQSGETVHEGKGGYIDLRAYGAEEWVKVPETKVPGTKIKAYGKLAGKAVPAAVWNDIRSQFGSQPETQVGKIYDWTLRAWKISKALALDTPIPTPTGWTTMGDLKPGDTVFDERGKPCEVLQATEVQHDHECYEVEFSDGTTIVADAGHLWFTLYRGKPGVRETREILATLKERTRGDNNHSIPVAGELDLPAATLPVSPYALGLWLGDGRKANACMSVGGKDADELIGHLNASGVECGPLRADSRSNVFYFHLRAPGVNGRLDGRRRNESVQANLRALGVLNNKHVPAAYLRASEAQRRELLMGLMDSDGHITDRGLCGFVTTDAPIKDGILELLRSLGYKPTAVLYEAKRNGRPSKPAWKITFKAYADRPVFKLARKAERLGQPPSARQRSQTRQIVAVTPVPSVPVRCILVSSESHLFLAGEGMVPTHNTALSPAVHMNNVMANVVLADLADVRVTDMMRAFRVLRAAKRGDAEARALVDRYEDSGAEQGSLAAQELRLGTIQQMLDEINEEQDRDLGLLKISQLVSMAAHGEVGAALRGLKSKKELRTAAVPFKKLIDAYRMEDSVFRLAAFLRRLEDGYSDLEAGQSARDAFLNYDINAPWISALRRGPLPFIAFSYRAIPMMMRAAVEKPWKVAKYAAIGQALNAVAYMMLGLGGDDERRERALLPEEKSGSMLGVFPRLLRMPWNDEHGSPVFLDVRRWVPAGDVFDVHGSQGAVPLPGWLTVGGPLALAMELMMNKSSFTGNPVVLETDTTAEAMAKVSDHLFKFMAPNLPIPNPLGWVADDSVNVPGLWQTYSVTGLMNAGKGMTDPFGRERSLPQAAASSVGIKLGAYPADQLRFNASIEHRRNVDEIRRQVRAIARSRARGGMDADEANERMAAQREKLRRINEKLREKMEGAR